MAGVSEEFEGLIRELFYSAQKIPKLLQIVLYGSVARGEEDRRSDIDLLLVFESEGDPEKSPLARVARREIGGAFVKAKCDRNAQIAMTNLKDIDESFLENVSREGIVVWGKPLLMDAKKLLRPMVLFEYRVGGSSKVDKVRFYRALKSIDATKVKNGILVPEENAKDIENIFKINNIDHKKKRLWLS